MILKFINKFFINSYIILCRIIFGMSDKVLFESFNGKSYSDNTKAVSEKLHQLYPDAKIIWAFVEPESKKVNLPNYVQVVSKRNYFTYYKAFATSKVFVTNFGIPYYSKSKKQTFIQLWHGDRAFKKILYDTGFRTEKNKLSETIDGYCDFAVAGSEYGIMQYRSAFRYKGEILKIGTPRDDCLVNVDYDRIEKLKNDISVPSDTKIVLYAPTLRNEAAKTRGKQQIQDINLGKVLDTLEKKYNCNWVCFVRAHAAVGGLCGVDNDSRIMDMTKYEDMADLLLISDVLITDYSSSAGDFALLNRPVLLFQSDRKEYEENDRNFYFKMEDSPYYIAENQDELEKLILNLDDEEVKKNCEEILKFYDTNEPGNASEKVAEIIIKHIKS